ncbi:cytochrome P450 [Cucurbitaria berberidis CBS 394.84]|uniref:Cytochrome P450 n=1 Tax=Cucurbitaria berberidis CBS 394.84 TaxID=1168544 RepID=A0A9P4GEQ4_9PLEO|nr:cytochrome P450 [Cucurbitaria berberidis CBS 394.84]KAF1844200.1 cytochrome P450 [Cucurbitaria berberidis CBS 394.84]
MELMTTVLVCGATTLVLYALYGAIWRLYLSPIANFPGSKAAAVTFWYEFYYDVVKGGAYVYEIERMHERYGPIIRINPYELHINDIDLEFMSKLYPSVGIDVDKFWWSAGMFGNVEMTFGTIPHHLHKMRRAAFAKFLSPAYIRKLEPVLQELVNILIQKIEEGIESGKEVNLVHAFSALTQDVITEYCFSFSRNCLQKEDFSPHWYNCIKQFPWLLPMLNKLPNWWVKRTDDAVWLIRQQEAEYLAQTRAVMSGGDADKTSHVTIFHEILDEPSLPPAEKTEMRMKAEATSIVGAGTLTSAHMLSLTSYFILSNPDVLKRLVAELETAMPNAASSPSQQVFESLPYLNAVINEGFRLSYGSMHRLSRSHPHDALQYHNWNIPPGTPVGYSAYMLHRNPEIFPDPENFDPERWLNLDAAERQRLRAHLNNFGRGTRQCVGMRLAYAELYLTLGYVFRRLGNRLQLHDTKYERDIKFVQDYFIPAPSRQSRGVRVVEKKSKSQH